MCVCVCGLSEMSLDSATRISIKMCLVVDETDEYTFLKHSATFNCVLRHRRFVHKDNYTCFFFFSFKIYIFLSLSAYENVRAEGIDLYILGSCDKKLCNIVACFRCLTKCPICEKILSCGSDKNMWQYIIYLFLN